MQHRVSERRLKRDKDHRKALLRNLSDSLFTHGAITTTETKAKFVKPYAEKLITRAKDKTYTNIKLVKAKLTTDIAARKLFEEIAPQFSGRPGGYTRIVKLGFRDGDSAPMARLELVTNEVPKEEKKTEKVAKKKIEPRAKKETTDEKVEVAETEVTETKEDITEEVTLAEEKVQADTKKVDEEKLNEK